MTATLETSHIEDETAISIALAVATANSKASELGYDLKRMTVRVTQEVVENVCVWHIYYCPINYINMRGGDLKVWVNAEDNSIVRVLRGQ